CYACGVNPRVDFGTVRLNTTAFQSEITSAAREFGVDEAVVRAIIHAESAYNPTALSRAGAQGLMQLMPPTAARFGVSDSYDAGQNIRGGVQYLAWLLKRF
ncbi:lytic transglycosylase domain-containing protein, partial [Klebsiella pneumoniae]|uniref:lytic transglycosylase domain-containing protein n=2 Tax=Gammaproteobacteria TaxID=1236 RepID=UPI003F2901A0